MGSGDQPALTSLESVLGCSDGAAHFGFVLFVAIVPHERNHLEKWSGGAGGAGGTEA
jgi:hypothetical protein